MVRPLPAQVAEFTADIKSKPASTTTSAKRINPGLPINSACDETKPMLSPDGRKLYFARKRSPMNTGGVTDPQDIWVSSFDGKKWSPARNAGPAFNSPRADNLCAVVNDSSYIFFIKDTPRTGYFELREIIRGRIKSTSTIGPRVQSTSPYLEASFSEDLTVVVFTASNRSNIYSGTPNHERDIFVSIKHDETWSKPVNVGPRINSKDDEFSPFLGPDKRTLFFAAERADTHGGVDIYYAGRLDDTWTSWSEPVNLGPHINTPEFDGYFTSSKAGQAFIVTYSQTYGKGDIIAVENPLGHLDVNPLSGDLNSIPTLPSLYFKRGTTTLTSESVTEFIHLVQELKARPNLKVEVLGHTDNEGTGRALLKLSRKRVLAVKTLLRSSGVEGSRISGKGLGCLRPAATNNSEEGKQKNRRVELIFKTT